MIFHDYANWLIHELSAYILTMYGRYYYLEYFLVGFLTEFCLCMSKYVPTKLLSFSFICIPIWSYVHQRRQLKTYPKNCTSVNVPKRLNWNTIKVCMCENTDIQLEVGFTKQVTIIKMLLLHQLCGHKSRLK